MSNQLLLQQEENLPIISVTDHLSYGACPSQENLLFHPSNSKPKSLTQEEFRLVKWIKRFTILNSLLLLVIFLALLIIAVTGTLYYGMFVAVTVTTTSDTTTSGTTTSVTTTSDITTSDTTTSEATTSSIKNTPLNKSYTTLSNDHNDNVSVPVNQTVKRLQFYSDNLSQSMDMNTAPCDDFYQYVCGNWNSSIGIYQHENTFEAVQLALEEHRAAPSSSKAVHYLTDLYSECINGSARQALGYEPVRQLLSEVVGQHELPLFVSPHWKSVKLPESINGHWDFNWDATWKLWNQTAPIKNDSIDVNQWMDCFVQEKLLDIDTLVDVSDFEVTKNQTRFSITIPQKYHSDDDDLYQQFKVYRSNLMIFFELSEWSNQLDMAIFEVMQFKITLGQLHAQFNETSWVGNVTKMTLGELNRDAAFNWEILLNKLSASSGASHRFTEDHRVTITEDLKLHKAHMALIATTPIRVLKNFILLQILEEKEKVLRNLHIDKSQVSSGENVSLWRSFVEEDFETLLPLYIRLFADHVGREKMHATREKVQNMVAQFKQTFADSLMHQYPWLDNRTREYAVKKLEGIHWSISYPDWIFEDALLDEEFGFINSTGNSLHVIKGNFATSYFNLIRHIQSVKFRKAISEEKDIRRTFDFTFEYDAWNLLESNKIAIGHDLLTEPSFNVDYPTELNLGVVGWTIGHELIHSFDNDGRLLDVNGEESNWWSPEAAKQFEKRAQCFVRQYGALREPAYEFRVNGTKTLGENIADNGAVKLAYKVLEVQPENRDTENLPNFLRQFTREQLFFIAYSKFYCQDYSFMTISDALSSLEDTHSPTKLVINGPLTNFDKFSDAFQCAPGSRMNPKEKCDLW